MSNIALSVDVHDSISLIVNRLDRELTPKEAFALKKNMGIALATLITEHFAGLDQARHHDFAPENFYEDAAHAVNPKINPGAVIIGENDVTVRIDKEGILQRYQGGPIDAKPGHALTIPISDEAYGHRAGEKNDLELLVLGENHIAVLARRPQSELEFRTTKDGRQVSVHKRAPAIEQEFMYLLVKHVDQNPDPTVLPEESSMEDAAIFAANDYIETLMGGAN